MSWIEHHSVSERLASEAQVASRKGQCQRARELYADAADAEYQAVMELDVAKTRTLGISVVSAASLYYKAGMFARSAEVALHPDFDDLPDFAKEQLKELLKLLEESRRVQSVLLQADKLVEYFEQGTEIRIDILIFESGVRSHTDDSGGTTVDRLDVVRDSYFDFAA